MRTHRDEFLTFPSVTKRSFGRLGIDPSGIKAFVHHSRVETSGNTPLNSHFSWKIRSTLRSDTHCKYNRKALFSIRPTSREAMANEPL